VAQSHRHLPHLLYRFLHGSRAETPQGSLPACASGDVAQTTSATRIHPITEWPSLFPTPIPAPPSIGLAASLPFWRKERYGLTTFRTSTMDEEGSACSPVAPHLRETMRERLHLATSLLGQACQPLWLVGSHDVYQQCTSVSHVIPPSLPTAVGLAVVPGLSRVAHHLAVRLPCPKSFIPSGCPGRMSW
jgi:hypothetical protein